MSFVLTIAIYIWVDPNTRFLIKSQEVCLNESTQECKILHLFDKRFNVCYFFMGAI